MDLNTSLSNEISHGCGCSACAQGEGGVSNFLLSNLENGGGSDGSILSAALDPDSNALDILSGFSQGAGNGAPITIEYKFHTGYESYWAQDSSFSYNTSGMSTFSANQQAAVNDILDMLESFTNITFQEVSGSANPSLGFINASAADGSSSLGGSAYYPTGWNGAGDVFINKDFWGYNSGADAGDVNFFILLHEIGHALGLEHTFSAGLTGAENTEQYSVMAYDSAPWGNVYAESYQLFDIASLQELYGVNTSYNAGDTVYTLESGKAYTIWDGGGVDTLDGSHLSSGLTINLDAGTFSSVGLTENIAIAYGAVIENANGGSGGDIIYGNDTNNAINGNNGNDTIHGSAGNDLLLGGDGNDTVVYTSALSNFIFTFVDAVTVMIEDIVGSFGSDTLSFFETFSFDDVSYDYAGLQAAGTSAAPDVIEPIRTRLFWDGGKDLVWSSVAGDNTYTAADIGLSGFSGDVIAYNRDADGLEVDILQDVGFLDMRIDGSDGSDHITVNGLGTTDLRIAGDDSDDVIDVNINGNDQLFGGDGDDTIFAGSGLDLLYGGNGDDTVHGEGGIDRINGDAGNDTLYGGDGNDRLSGQIGNDTLNGDDGADRLYGGDGDDILIGGADKDLLWGDAGADTFGFTAIDSQADILQDFDLSAGDKLNITDILDGFQQGVDDISDFVSLQTRSDTRTDLWVNEDGQGTDFVRIAVVRGTDFTGVDANDLLNSGALITDQTLL